MDEQTTGAVADWELRFRAARVSLPEWAQDAPHRCLYVSNATGTYELYAWDRAAGTHRQVTSRPNGTSDGALTPEGETIWWFDDTDGDEYGVWRVQPFGGPPRDGAPDPEAAPGLAAAYSAGLALGRGGLAVVGRADDDYGTEVSVVAPGKEPRRLYAHAESATVGDLSEDGAWVVLAHSEHGDSRHPALRVLRVADAATVAELSDAPGKGLHPLGFAPVDGDPRLLVAHERRGRSELLLWDVASGAVDELDLGLPGEVGAEWFPGAAALLVEHEHAARSELYRFDLAERSLTRLETPHGVVGAATARPDGVELSWSSSAEPSVVRDLAGRTVLAPAGPRPPRSVPVQDVWVDGPGGRIHALVSLPAGPAPHPAVFLVHGGPAWQDFDSFAADVAAYVDCGLAVVRVNYRGSTGYGSAWRDAIEHRVGVTELEDLAAVHHEAVSRGLVDPGRVVLSGGSWGGFLTLLGLGRQPQLWSLGVAAVPVADYVAAYADEMEPLKAYDRSLFGGSPEEVPERYRESSPITYVDDVRAPVLVIAGENDPRCPIRQVENYLQRLRGREAPHEVYRYDAGHGSLVVEERVRQMRVELDFLARHVPGVRAPG
ncbi:S9 family peptidase [Motilibacter aurantiacus]|uniref:S9 family peptidase n=1 Tax=Motilibacter aurantiacus TaxID=2714955 RepID=UPI001407E5AE|nr:prolyl oligopeptidase family serine peptidase [Motilibacter aurantiacus]NHC44398.1 S9 family peptidase [Motilibacter aurantiacus]